MTTETEGDFAAFEAQATSGETIEAKEPEAKEPEAKEPDAKEPLELTDGDEAVEVPDGEEGGEPDPKDEGGKRRSKPASQRIAEVTAKWKAAERELEALRNPPAEEAKEAPKRPDPADYEFGDADPAFIEALTDWKIETREAEKAKDTDKQREQQAWQHRIETGVAKAQAEAQERYEDFDDKIAAAVEARSGEPLPPLLSIAIGVSPVGADLLYRLATDPAVSERLETLAKGGKAQMRNMAVAFGEIEGEYLTDTSDSDLDLSDPEDMARMMGRMKARLNGKPAERAKPTLAVTTAPEPPAQRARGGSGQFEVRGDTSDFAAFERKANGK